MTKDLRHPLTDALSDSALVGHLVTATAHQLRNPLTAMSSTLQVLMMRLTADSPHRDVLEAIAAETDRLAAVISEMVDFCAQPILSKERRDLIEDLNSRLVQWRPYLEEQSLLLHTHYAVEACPMIMGPDEFEQIFNYLLRFLAFTAQKGSTLHVSVRRGLASDAELEWRMAQTTEASVGGDVSFAEFPTMPGASFGVALCDSMLRQYGYRFSSQKDGEGRWIFSVLLPRIASYETQSSYR